MDDSRIPTAFRADVAAMPGVLQRLIGDELNAGNEIDEVGHAFPASPAGGYVKLVRHVTTRPRASGDGLQYRARNSSLSAGEFTDEKRFYFVLEPAGAPPADADMDAIRAADDAPRPTPRPQVEGGAAPIERFVSSMVIDYDKWDDGIGYDLEALRAASRAEQASVESRLVPPSGWRDVEALAALADTGSITAGEALRAAMASTNSEVRLAVTRFAPELIDADVRTASLLSAMETAAPFGGLDATLAQVEEFHPPDVVAALFRLLLTRDGETACNYAGMVAFLHGKAASSFDWSLRPLFLQFNTTDMKERVSAFRALCELCGVDADPLLAASHASDGAAITNQTAAPRGV
ncbi:MAG: hypothetical protein ABIP93_12485 [Gemmatimonadaceae bacterium]